MKRYDELDSNLMTYSMQPSLANMWFTPIGSNNIEYMPRQEDAFHLDDSEMFRCSWCDVPSAVLKKCGGCRQTLCVIPHRLHICL